MDGTMRDTVTELFTRRVWELNPRKGTRQPRLLLHRFPIKGGLTLGQAFGTLNNRNVLLDMVKLK